MPAVRANRSRSPVSLPCSPRAQATPRRRDELAERVRAGALDSVRAHCLADVEIGVFLSAGIDSGAVLGLLCDAGQR